MRELAAVRFSWRVGPLPRRLRWAARSGVSWARRRQSPDVSGKVRGVGSAVIRLTMAPAAAGSLIDVLGTLWTLPAGGRQGAATDGPLRRHRVPELVVAGRTDRVPGLHGRHLHIWTMRPDGSGPAPSDAGRLGRPRARLLTGRRARSRSRRTAAAARRRLDPGRASGALRQLTHAGAGRRRTTSPHGRRTARGSRTSRPPGRPADRGDGRRRDGQPERAATRTRRARSLAHLVAGRRRIAYVLHDPATAVGARRGGRLTEADDRGARRSRTARTSSRFPRSGSRRHGFCTPPTAGSAERDLATGSVRNDPLRGNGELPAHVVPGKRRTTSRPGGARRAGASPTPCSRRTDARWRSSRSTSSGRCGSAASRSSVTDDVYYKATPFWSPDGSHWRIRPTGTARRRSTSGHAHGRERKLTGPFAGSQVRGPGPRTAARSRSCPRSTASGNAATYVADVATGEIRQILTPLFEPGRPTWGRTATLWRSPHGSRTRPLPRGAEPDPDRRRDDRRDHVARPVSVQHDQQPQGRLRAGVVAGRPPHGLRPRRRAVGAAGRRRGAPAGEQRQLTDENADADQLVGRLAHAAVPFRRQAAARAAAGGGPTTVAVDLQWRRDVPQRRAGDPGRRAVGRRGEKLRATGHRRRRQPDRRVGARGSKADYRRPTGRTSSSSTRPADRDPGPRGRATGTSSSTSRTWAVARAGSCSRSASRA